MQSAGLVRFFQLFENRVPVPVLNQVQVLKLEVLKDRVDLHVSTQTQANPLDKGPVVKSLPVFSSSLKSKQQFADKWYAYSTYPSPKTRNANLHTA